MSITLRTNKNQGLTYDEMDINLSSYYYSSSVFIDNSNNKYLRLYYTGSESLGSGSYIPRFDEIKISDKKTSTLTYSYTSNVDITEAAPANTVFPSGMTFDEFVEKIAVNTFTPQLIAPTFGLSLDTKIATIGATIPLEITFNFNRGDVKGDNIGGQTGTWSTALSQGKRAGIANEYNINGINNSTGSVLTINHSVVQGINKFEGEVSYNQGIYPKDSEGNNYSSPLPAGTSPVQQATLEGVYPLFATISNITTLTELSLYSMLNANNIEIELKGETGGNKQKFEIPDVWLTDRGTPKIEYFNTVSNQYDNTDKIADFDTSPETKTIESNTVNYTRFTHNKSDRFGIKIRLIF